MAPAWRKRKSRPQPHRPLRPHRPGRPCRSSLPHYWLGSAGLAGGVRLVKESLESGVGVGLERGDPRRNDAVVGRATSCAGSRIWHRRTTRAATRTMRKAVTTTHGIEKKDWQRPLPPPLFTNKTFNYYNDTSPLRPLLTTSDLFIEQ